MRLDLDCSLRDWPYVVLRFRCNFCQRAKDARLAVCAARFGPRFTIGELLDVFVAGCQWNPHDPTWKPPKYGPKCGPHMPELTSDRPPDNPPTMTNRKLIKGGKNNLRPAQPAKRRAGER